MLMNWDLSNVASLNLPHTINKLYNIKFYALAIKFTKVYCRSLVNCNLLTVPEEVRALDNLIELDLAHNQLKTIDKAFASSTTLIKLNASHNVLDSYKVSLPQLRTLDLSANALIKVPKAVLKSPLLNDLRVIDNKFDIAAIPSAQYNFFAGLSEFRADFADVSTCAPWALAYLQGNSICLSNVASAEYLELVIEGNNTDKEEPLRPVAPSHVNSSYLPRLSTSSWNYIIAAIVIVVVIGLIAGVVALISLGVMGGVARAVYDCIGKWQKKRDRKDIHENTPLFFDQVARAGYQKEIDAVDKLFPSNDPVLVTWRIDYDSVKLVRKIANGAFGEVWVGQYHSARVAVKRLIQEQVSLTTSEAFLREVKLMAWLEHPKIVQFVGVAWTKLVDMLAVIEYMDGGDLRSLLEKKSPTMLPWQEGGLKLQYARDTIDAIVYLHSLSVVIIHRDLKSRNILLDSKKGAKLGDFGVSATKRQHDMTSGVGTARWLAPEIARGDEIYTEAIDVYSFGVILSELDTHQLPFADARTNAGAPLNDMAILQGVSSGTLQVSLSSTCPRKLAALARRCMSLDSTKRPTAALVAYELRKRDFLL